jgi:hypothetical protein
LYLTEAVPPISFIYSRKLIFLRGKPEFLMEVFAALGEFRHSCAGVIVIGTVILLEV